jgi:hypothetical protein
VTGMMISGVAQVPGSSVVWRPDLVESSLNGDAALTTRPMFGGRWPSEDGRAHFSGEQLAITWRTGIQLKRLSE